MNDKIVIKGARVNNLKNIDAVSYTHLDVYKRQLQGFLALFIIFHYINALRSAYILQHGAVFSGDRKSHGSYAVVAQGHLFITVLLRD